MLMQSSKNLFLNFCAGSGILLTSQNILAQEVANLEEDALTVIEKVESARQFDIKLIDDVLAHGIIKSFDSNQLSLQTESETISINIEDIVEIKPIKKNTEISISAHLANDSDVLYFSDGSFVNCQEFCFQKSELSYSHDHDAEKLIYKITASSVSAIQLMNLTKFEKPNFDWQELKERIPRKSDQLVLLDASNNSLNIHDINVLYVDNKKLKFKFDGDADTHEVNFEGRAKPIVGVLFGNVRQVENDQIGSIETISGSKYYIKNFTFDPNGFKFTTVSDLQVLIPENHIFKVDLSHGKIQSLKKLNILNLEIGKESKHRLTRLRTPNFNQSLNGNPITIGALRFNEGLSLQAGTDISFEITPEMQRFKALVALEPDVKISGAAEIFVYLTKDKKETLNSNFILKSNQQIEDLNIDISDADILRIKTIPLQNLSYSDIVNFADARVTK